MSGDVRKSDEAKTKRIEQMLRRSHLKGAPRDIPNGRILFTSHCSACHTLYGQGGKLAPDLTGSGRADLGYLLENIIDPSAVVSNEYRMTVFKL